MPPAAASTQESARRPTPVLFVYCWDLFLAILAVFGALAPFAGGVEVANGTRAFPLVLQIVGALSSAAYAAVLAILASLLTRRHRWIQRMQVRTLLLAVVLAVLSLSAGAVVGGGVTLGPLLVTLLFLLLDIAAVLVMTDKRVSGWYTEPGPAPWYATWTLGFWAATAVLLVALDLVI